MKNIVGISGSTRKGSTNHQLLQAIGALLHNRAALLVYEGIERLPHFNPDDDREEAPAAVAAFRNLLDAADGIIICTPEYAHGVPGTLKNAIDWTVSSCQFSHKPTLLITASTEGQFGHRALLDTLRVIEAKNIDALQLVIPFIKTKVKEGKITDEPTLREINGVLQQFMDTVNGS